LQEWEESALDVNLQELSLRQKSSKSPKKTNMLSQPHISILGQDPNRTHRINANSFQQDALTTINGLQYAAFYTSPSPTSPGTCHINLSRRRLSQLQKWENVVLDDYEQRSDDGHNTISVGVCKGDGTVHVAFDHHCDRYELCLKD